MILKERGDLRSWQFVPAAETCHAIFAYTGQRAIAAGPDAAVSRREHRRRLCRAQAFGDSQAGDRRIGQAINAVSGRHPDVSFTILREVVDAVTRQAAGPVEVIDAFAVDAIDATIIGANPDRTFTIDMERCHDERTPSEGRSIERLPAAVDQTLETQTRTRLADTDPHRPLRRRCECHDSDHARAPGQSWQTEDRWRASCPAQEQRVAANPDGPVAIGHDRHGVERWNAVGSAHALQARSQHATQRPIPVPRPVQSEPQRPIAVLGESVRAAPRAGREGSERVRLPATQRARGIDPDGPIARRLEAKHFRGRQPLAVARRPPPEADAVELHDAVGSPDPDVAIRCLNDCRWGAVERAILHPPRGMRVLSDALGGIDGPC